MATLRYDFEIVNQRAIDQAFSSVEQRAARHNAKMNAMFGAPRGARAGVGGTSGVNQAAQEQRKAAREQEARQRKYQQSLSRQHKMDIQFIRKRRAEEKRSEEARKKALDRERAHQANVLKRADRAQSLERRRMAQVAFAERRRSLGGLYGTIGNSVQSSTRAIAGGALGALGIGGGILAHGAVSQQSRETTMASQLANQAGDPKLKGRILREAQSIRGLTGEEAMSGMSAFIEKTGNLDAGRALIADMGKLAIATGTELEDLGRTAGQAFTVLADGASSPQEAINQTRELLATLAKQGNMGAVEIKDLAKDFGKLGAATRAFEGGAPDLLRTMGAFAQIAVARGGAESSADASTAATRLASDIVTKRSKFEGILGAGKLQSKTDKTKLRDPLEIMLDILDKTGGDVMKTGGLFGMESGKIFRGLGATYSAAEARQKGSGREAVKTEFNKLAGAKMSTQEIGSAFESRMSDPDMQYKELMKEFNMTVGSELLPELTKLVPEFAKLIPHVRTAARIFGKFVETLLSSPLMTLGTLIAGRLVMDIAAAKIGESAKKAFVDSLSGGASGSGGAGAGAGPGNNGKGIGLGSAVFNGVTIGAAVGLSIFSSGVVNFEASEVNMERSGERVTRAREIMQSGEYKTEAGRKELQMLSQQAMKETDRSKKTTFFEDIAGLMPFWFSEQKPSSREEHGKQIAGTLAETNTLSRNEDEIRQANRQAMEYARDAAKQQLEAADKSKNTADRNAIAADKMVDAASQLEAVLGAFSLGAPGGSRPRQGT